MSLKRFCYDPRENYKQSGFLLQLCWNYSFSFPTAKWTFKLLVFHGLSKLVWLSSFPWQPHLDGKLQWQQTYRLPQNTFSGRCACQALQFDSTRPVPCGFRPVPLFITQMNILVEFSPQAQTSVFPLHFQSSLKGFKLEHSNYSFISWEFWSP